MNVECGRDNFSRDLLASSKELPASKISETTETLNIYTLIEFSLIGFFFYFESFKNSGSAHVENALTKCNENSIK